MLFDFDLVVPAGSAADAPVVERVGLIYGTLSQVRVVFPPGPATLVHVVVRDKLRQIVPANQDGSLNFDDSFIVSTMEYPITDVPFELTLVGWSPDAKFDHTITFQFELQPSKQQNWDNFLQALFESQPSRPGSR